MAEVPPANGPAQPFQLDTEWLYKQASVTLHANINEQIIVITEDKVMLCLQSHLSRVESKNGWHTPLGILLTLGLVFTTTDFKVTGSLSADFWRAFFAMGTILALVWLVRTLLVARKSSSMTDVVQDMKAKRVRDISITNKAT